DLSLYTDPTYPWSVSRVGLPLLIAVALLLTGLTVWTYLGARGSTFRRMLAVLGLRLGALLLAFLAVLRPALAFRGELRHPSVLVVAVDDSESMTIQDEFDGQSRWERVQRILRKCEPELRKLREQYEVTVALHRFSEGVRPLDPDDAAAKADGKRSDYGRMMRELFDRYGGERYLRGLVVMGDGAQNGVQPDPLAVAGEWRGKCPVHTFAFGKTTTSDRHSDIALTDITIDRSPIPAKGKFVVTAIADAPGFENREVIVRLFIDDKPVPVLVGEREEVGHKETLRLTTGNELKVTANAPTQSGEIKVTLKIDKLEGELAEFNNEISTFATVSQEGVGVLYVDKRREERAFLLEALASDPRIRVDRVTLGGGAPAEGGLFHLNDRAYDVIILGDVTGDEVRRADPAAPANIKRLVQEKGAGIMMIGGRRNFGNGRWAATELRDVLPVDLSDGGEVNRETISLVRTPVGKEHYLLRLADDPRENDKVWEELKLYGGLSRMGKPKSAGTDVLLRSREGDDVLVAGEVGGGRSVAFAGDTTYLWVRPPKGDQYHQRFWRQLVLWLAHQEKTESKLWVKSDARRVKAGRRLGFSAGIRGKDGQDLKGATFDAKVVGPAPAQLGKTRDHDEERVTVEAGAPGEYQLVVEGHGRDADGQEVRGKETVRFLVSQDDAEMTRRAADHEFLKRLAAAGGGKFHPGDEEELARYLRELPSQPLGGLRPKPDLWPDWRRAGASAFPPAFLLVFVALVSLEWFFRRRWGMA
ncbi:MAG TPA: glutamine amidotransferase, partial [Gemmataceae bacterium]|nr:glutamine amidotransferase [Gemmataceae bacterium]